MMGKLKKKQKCEHDKNKIINDQTVYESILSYWFYSYNILQNIEPVILSEIWTNIWFAKNKKQTFVDNELNLKFSSLYEILDKKNIDYQHLSFHELFALIILYDQMSRNIFRKTAKAYEYDIKTRHIIDIIYKKTNTTYKTMIQTFPIQICIHVMLVYVHSENIDDQQIQKYICNELKQIYSSTHTGIIKSLSQISENHFMRINIFKRIPERNIYLNRESTKEEIDFLTKLYQ